jgi:hypothetical protein
VTTNSRPHGERLRLFTEESNAVHEQYRSDAKSLRQFRRFIKWQVAYLLPFFSEFEARPDTAAAVEFIVSDLMGSGIAARDADLARVIPIMVRLLPDRALEALASAMQLNARTLAINLANSEKLAERTDIGEGISERDFCAAFRSTTTLEECLELIGLTIVLGHTLKRLVRNRMLRMTLHAMHYPAHAAGFGAMQDFLEKGYTTFHAIDDVDYFLGQFAERITAVFTRLCEEPLEDLDPIPVRYG